MFTAEDVNALLLIDLPEKVALVRQLKAAAIIAICGCMRISEVNPSERGIIAFYEFLIPDITLRKL